MIREGTTQGERFPAALNPAYAPVDERGIKQGIAYARAYAFFLQYYDAGNNKAGDWQPFFSQDVSALLAVMAMQNVEEYRTKIKEYIQAEEFGKLSSCIGMLARQLDVLKEGLPAEYPLKGILHNLITNRLQTDFNKLILYVRDQHNDKSSSWKSSTPTFKVIRSVSNTAFLDILEQHHFSKDWIVPKTPEVPEQQSTAKDKQTEWTCYLRKLYCQAENSSASSQETDLASKDLKKISDQFLKVYARTVTEAKRAFGESLTKWSRHDPHYALFLAFLRLLEHARKEMNTLTGRHLDFYYRDILRFKEKEIVPPKAHVLVELAKKVPSHLMKKGELFKAGKDESGKDVFFASKREFVANRAQVAELKTVYRHGAEPIKIKNDGKQADPTTIHEGRLYASSVANSADGVGGELISEDKSWHPFFNKIYEDNKTYQKDKLLKIEMPKAEVGFAIASHYLWMAGGARTITITFSKEQGVTSEGEGDVTCYFTGEKEWIKKEAKLVATIGSKNITLTVELSGGDPAVVPYSTKTHGYNFQTDLPVLRVELTHQNTEKYSYDSLKNIKFNKIDLTVDVKKLKALAVSNDFGPVDTSKPFQPFGASPVEGSSLIIGSNEVCQKEIANITFSIDWKKKPKAFGGNAVEVELCYLKDNTWVFSPCLHSYHIENAGDFNIAPAPPDWWSVGDKPIFSDLEFYHINAKSGYARLSLDSDFGQKSYEQELINYVTKLPEQKNIEDILNGANTIKGSLNNCSSDDDKNDKIVKDIKDELTQIENSLESARKPEPPVIPVATQIIIDYKTKVQTMDLEEKGSFEKRLSRFFNIAPFGHAEQHPYLKNIPKKENAEFDENIYLVPQFKHVKKRTSFKHEAEFYIGITDLKPPQNLSLLFQVADGTSDPQVIKPTPQHVHWSYLSKNEWIDFPTNTVEDYTDELITSGIIIFSVPRGASDDNTLLPAGMHWIRAAVASAPDAVCRLRMVAAQAVKVQFVDKENDPNFSAKALPKESITKLARPAAAVKKILQPFPSYGGRGKEESRAFYTRVSERLRHKDRAVTLWDYERLILEAFPEVHKVKCLNHTRYEFDEKNKKHVYDTMAPGHVTVVTIADQDHHSLPDPLRPNVSLGLQKKIEEFIQPRLSSSVKLHIVNPKFKEVQVVFQVKFHSGFDETYSINLLKESLVRFLSPWTFPGGSSPSFGGKIYKSALINFVEEQSCVNYLTDFQLFVDGGEDTETAEGSEAISILTSVPASMHRINEPEA